MVQLYILYFSVKLCYEHIFMSSISVSICNKFLPSFQSL